MNRINNVKLGDKLRVVDAVGSYGYSNGDIVTVESLIPGYPGGVRVQESLCPLIWSEVEPVKTLKEMENTVVECETQAEYNELMQIYEDAGWTWISGDKPTNKDNWASSETCIKARNNFQYTQRQYYISNGYSVISLEKFKNIQGLGAGWKSIKFDEYKPVLIDNWLVKSNRKGIMSYLRDIPNRIKRVLDKNTKAMYQLEWIDEELDLSSKGKNVVWDILQDLDIVKDELGKRAVKRVAEINKENKK